MRIRSGHKTPEVHAIGTTILDECLVGDSLRKLDRIVNVGVLVDVTLCAWPSPRKICLALNGIERLASAGVVVLAVEVVLAVTLAHILDAVDTPGPSFGKVDIALRTIIRVNRLWLVCRTDEGS